MTVTINLLEVELVHFSIEKHSQNGNDVITDIRTSINGGYSDYQIFVELTINSKVFVETEMCSVTSFSRFDLSSTDTKITDDVIKSKELIEVISQMCVMASSHQMGIFRIKSEGTQFDTAVIPARSAYEYSKDLYLQFNPG